MMQMLNPWVEIIYIRLINMMWILTFSLKAKPKPELYKIEWKPFLTTVNSKHEVQLDVKKTRHVYALIINERVAKENIVKPFLSKFGKILLD